MRQVINFVLTFSVFITGFYWLFPSWHQGPYAALLEMVCYTFLGLSLAGALVYAIINGSITKSARQILALIKGKDGILENVGVIILLLLLLCYGAEMLAWMLRFILAVYGPIDAILAALGIPEPAFYSLFTIVCFVPIMMWWFKQRGGRAVLFWTVFGCFGFTYLAKMSQVFHIYVYPHYQKAPYGRYVQMESAIIAFVFLLIVFPLQKTATWQKLECWVEKKPYVPEKKPELPFR